MLFWKLILKGMKFSDNLRGLCRQVCLDGVWQLLHDSSHFLCHVGLVPLSTDVANREAETFCQEKKKKQWNNLFESEDVPHPVRWTLCETVDVMIPIISKWPCLNIWSPKNIFVFLLQMAQISQTPCFILMKILNKLKHGRISIYLFICYIGERFCGVKEATTILSETSTERRPDQWGREVWFGHSSRGCWAGYGRAGCFGDLKLAFALWKRRVNVGEHETAVLCLGMTKVVCFSSTRWMVPVLHLTFYVLTYFIPWSQGIVR